MEQTEIIEDFKLLAIRPRKGCHKRFRKLLDEGFIYQLYSDYDFTLDKDTKEVKTISARHSVPKGLFDSDKLKINISAIVGKNGSGKSTLLELFYYSQYILGTELKLLKTEATSKLEEISQVESTLTRLKRKLKNSKAVYKQFKGKLDEEEKKPLDEDERINEDRQNQLLALRKATSCAQEEMESLSTNINEKEDTIKLTGRLKAQEDKDHQFIRKNLKVSIFFQLQGVFWELRVDNGIDLFLIPSTNAKQAIQDKQKVEVRNMKLKILNEELSPTEYSRWVLSRFFYTVAVDYSLYSLNSTRLGSWISRLFHKNDGYHAPISINPMRKEGKFDVNQERDFAMQRLMQNLLLKFVSTEEGSETIPLTDKQDVKLFQFTLESHKETARKVEITKKGLGGNQEGVNLLMDLQRVFFDRSYQMDDYLVSQQPFAPEVYNYIVYKVNKISSTYSFYEDGYDFKLKRGAKKNIAFLHRLKDDDSHITYKLKQAVNFLRNNFNDSKGSWRETGEIQHGNWIYKFTPKELKDWMQFDSSDDLINHLPPPIFSVDLILDDSAEDNLVTFDSLSSGEQQLIHSIQAILYHLNNLNSVKASKDENRQTYNAVNIIYDEIELYFHPEYQRQFIDRLIKEIKNWENAVKPQGVKDLNILFSTHSPFILSDIPSANVLCLEDGQVTDQNNVSRTFGANIHEMLAEKFFLTEGTIGDFARHKIKETIVWLNGESKSESEFHRKLIKNIDEPIMQRKLAEMYDERVGDNLKGDVIDDQIDYLRQLKNQSQKRNDTSGSEQS